MQPSTTTLASGGVAGAVVICATWALHQFAHVDVPDYVQLAAMAIVAWGAGRVFHPMMTLGGNAVPK